MATIDHRLLLAGRGIDALDPMELEQKSLVLSNLARAGQMQQYDLDAKRRSEENTRAIGDVLGNLDVSDDAAVINAMQRVPPEARAAFRDYVLKSRHQLAQTSKERSIAGEHDIKSTAARFQFLGGIAGSLLQNPTREGLVAAQENLRLAGFNPQIIRAPDGVDQMEHLRQLATGSMDRATQLLNEDRAEGRKLTANRDAETAANYLRVDDRARQLHANQLAQAKMLREAGMAQAAATRAAGEAQAGATVSRRTTDVEMKLADDYKTQSKGWQETATAIGKVRAALKTADTNPGSALAAGTAFMKILDPNSVVRESELGMALNASGWFDRATNIVQTLRSGKVMTKHQTQNLEAAANALYEEAAATQRQIDAAYRKRAKDYGADPSRVIVDLGQNRSTQGGPAVLQNAPPGSGVDYVYTPRQ